MFDPNRVRAIDSHTGGEPTRIILDTPDLGVGPLRERCEQFRSHFDRFRSFAVQEPRGSDVLVGGLLVPPHDSRCRAGVIFFNNVGPLGMCGHGTIGLMVTLHHLKQLELGTHHIDTPVGMVTAELLSPNRVSVTNVPSWRHRGNVTVEVPGVGTVVGDVAWGGNWFFLTHEHDVPLRLDNVEVLTNRADRIRRALASAGVTGADGAEIDHIELFAPPADGLNHSRNFVLCPGGAYDRSPCGTGTSAKLACLAADGLLAPGQLWRQESILGSVFEATYALAENHTICPTITGTAYVTAEITLIRHTADPFADGIRRDSPPDAR